MKNVVCSVEDWMSASLADLAGWQPASRVRLGSLTSVPGAYDRQLFNRGVIDQFRK